MEVNFAEIMKITKRIKLEDTIYMDIERTSNGWDFDEKNFYIFDSHTQTRTLVAKLSNGKWSSPLPANLDFFFGIVKKHRIPVMNNIYKRMQFENEISVATKYKCFKRNVTVKVTRMTNHLTRNIKNAI
jgi:hypothetical protein